MGTLLDCYPPPQSFSSRYSARRFFCRLLGHLQEKEPGEHAHRPILSAPIIEGPHKGWKKKHIRNVIIITAQKNLIEEQDFRQEVSIRNFKALQSYKILEQQVSIW